MTQTTQGLALALIGLLLTGCMSAPIQPAEVDAARRSEFDKSLDGWNGASVKELIAKLGPPTSTSRQADGTRVYVYAKSKKLRGATGPIMFSCVVRYLVDARTDRVVGHRIEGC